jgi:hypothetical protein
MALVSGSNLMADKQPVVAFSPDDMARRRKRSIVLAFMLVALMVLFFVSTLVRLGANLTERAL